MKSLKWIIFSMLMLICISTTGFSQQDREREGEGREVEFRDESLDPNIITPKPEGGAAFPKPLATKARGPQCEVDIINATGYEIDIYIDGHYHGTLPPYRRDNTFAMPGDAVIYGRAKDGMLTWGPWEFPCGEHFIWKLYKSTR